MDQKVAKFISVSYTHLKRIGIIAISVVVLILLFKLSVFYMPFLVAFIIALTLEESAFLAGINNSPNSYNPFGEKDNSEKIKNRTNTVLAKMLELGRCV